MVFKVKPNTKPRMTRSDVWKNDPYHPNPKSRQRKCVTQYYKYKEELNAEAIDSGYLVTPELDLVFFIPMPVSWSKKKKQEMLGMPHQQTPDIDNLLKAFMDALCTQDNFVHTVKAKKIWATEGRIQINRI